jgi:carbohydrate-selective porin OprB
MRQGNAGEEKEAGAPAEDGDEYAAAKKEHNSPVQWIQVDPDLQWICLVRVQSQGCPCGVSHECIVLHADKHRV